MFATTRWSVVLSASEGAAEEEQARQALAELCRLYWRPIFSFVRRRGYSPEDAQDLTQDFFVMILSNNWLERADPNRGRFRSLLLKSLSNFLNNAAERDQAKKRGGDMTFVSWDDWRSEAASHVALAAPALDCLPAEQIFDVGWAVTVVERALGRLREECESKGRLRLFEVLSTHLTAERTDLSYDELAHALGIAATAVKKQLHNLRQRYRWLLRDEVAHTVADPVDVDDEIRYLCAALAGSNQTSG